MIKKGQCSLSCLDEETEKSFNVMGKGFYVNKNLFIHKQLDQDKKMWCVTHVHSGLLVVGPANKLSYMQALHIAHEVARLPIDFASENPLENIDDRKRWEISQKMREIIAEETHRLSKITDEIFSSHNVYPSLEPTFEGDYCHVQ